MTHKEPRRLVLDGLVIVVSILLAFAIDAGWNAHLARREAGDLREELRQDIVNTRVQITKAITDSEEISAGARVVLNAMASPLTAQQRDSLLSTVGSVFVMSTFDPVNDTYVEAIGSGRLRLIDNAELRLTLSQYESAVQLVLGLYDKITGQYYAQQEPFMVANTIYSDMAHGAWRDSLVAAPFRTEYAVLAKNKALWNLLTFRLELEVALQSHLKRLDRHAVAVLGLLGETTLTTKYP